MLRIRAALAAMLAVAVVGLGASPAMATPPPLGQFGQSDGPLTDASATGTLGYDNQLSWLANVLLPDGSTDGSFIRGAVHWTLPSTSGTWSTSKYDAFIGQAWSDGFQFLPELHTSKSGGGYIDPITCSGNGCGTSAFEAEIASFAERYGPGGTYTNSYNAAHPSATVPGITRYEVWNEPNTNTGTLNATNTNDTDPAEFDAILHAESVGLQTAAATWPSGQLQIACCAFGNPGTGNHAYSLHYFKELIAVPGNTVWSDINPSGALPGVITVHMYYGTLNPTTCSDTGGDNTSAEKCPAYLNDFWQPYITAAEPNDGMGITEGGYSGSYNNVCSYTNTVTEQQQSDDDAATINTYRADAASGLDLEFLAYYKAYDDSTSSDNGQSSCWQPGLAPVTNTGVLKKWGTEYKSIVAADHTVSNPAPTVTSFSPSSGEAGDSVDVTGTAFTGATSVTLNGNPASFTVNSATDITMTVPNDTGSGTIAVTTPYGTGTSTSSFSVTRGAWDSFTRTLTGGWGTTTHYGGAWTVDAGVSSDASVSGTQGVLALSSSTLDKLALDSMGVLDSTEASTAITLPALPSSGNNVTLALWDRVNAAQTTEYKATYQVFSSGNVTVTIKAVNAGTSTTVATQSAACAVTAGTPFTIVFNATGNSPTNLSASCNSGTAVTGTDSTASLQNANGTFLTTANGSTSLTYPYTVEYDDLTALAP